MAPKTPKVRPVVRRVQPWLQTVSELAVVSSSATPGMAFTSSEAPPLRTTVGRDKSRLHMVEKRVEKPSISKSSSVPKDEQDDYSGGRIVRHDRDGETKDLEQGRYPV